MRSTPRANKERDALGLKTRLRRTHARSGDDEVKDELRKMSFKQVSDTSDGSHLATRLNAARLFVSDPYRAGSEIELPPQNCEVQRKLNGGVLPLEQSGSSKRSKSSGAVRPKMAHVRANAEPVLSQVMMMSTEDAKGSGVKYNVVQFVAKPSLSTSCDNKEQTLKPRAPRAKPNTKPNTKPSTKEEAKSTDGANAPNREGPVDAESATDAISCMFRGWPKREVKKMLQKDYSPEEVAEVLQILSENESGKSKRSHSKQSTCSGRG